MPVLCASPDAGTLKLEVNRHATQETEASGRADGRRRGGWEFAHVLAQTQQEGWTEGCVALEVFSLARRTKIHIESRPEEVERKPELQRLADAWWTQARRHQPQQRQPGRFARHQPQQRQPERFAQQQPRRPEPWRR